MEIQDAHSSLFDILLNNYTSFLNNNCAKQFKIK